MPAKSHTYTQHAYMKLSLVVAMVIFANGVVANTTYVPVEHRRLGGILTSLRHGMSFQDEWKNAFSHQALKKKRFADTENLIGQMENVWEEAKSSSLFLLPETNFPSDRRASARLHNSITDFIRKLSPDAGADRTLNVLKNKNIPDVVKIAIINAGKLAFFPSARTLANVMELQLFEEWGTEGKTLSDRFQALQLNKMKTEMELYANPAFTTWMKYAVHLSQGDQDDQTEPFRLMLEVLQKDMGTSKGFKHLVKVSAGSEEEKKLFENWQYVYDERLLWHTY